MKQRHINIDPLSATSLRVEPRFNGIVLASATAFTIKFNNNDYLVTNWHVITGRDPDTGDCHDKKNASLPNEILVNFHARGKLGTWKKVVIKLFDSDGKPRWVEHPLGKEVDVVAIRIDASEDVDLHCLDLGLGDVDIVPMPAMPISVIGYPLGLTAGDSWPIWKTGHIASDPDIDFQLGRPAFLIDATTKSGMSGAPVVLRLDRYQKKDGNHVIAAGITTKFMGVYAGRIHNDSDVGRVWRSFVITELLNHRLIFNELTGRAAPKRSANCPCRSGKRFKECCGQST